MPVTDLNYIDQQGHASSHYYGLEQLVDVYRQTHFCTGNGLFTSAHSSQMYSALRWQQEHQVLYLPGSVPLHGLCAANLPRKLARYRSLPQSTKQQALSYWHTFKGCTQHTDRCQREKRLAHLRRLGTVINESVNYSV